MTDLLTVLYTAAKGLRCPMRNWGNDGTRKKKTSSTSSWAAWNTVGTVALQFWGLGVGVLSPAAGDEPGSTAGTAFLRRSCRQCPLLPGQSNTSEFVEEVDREWILTVQHFHRMNFFLLITRDNLDTDFDLLRPRSREFSYLGRCLNWISKLLQRLEEETRYR